MRSIRKFAYAAVLGLSMFTLQPTLAAAEDVHGSLHPDSRSALAKCVLVPEITPSPSEPGAVRVSHVTGDQRDWHERDDAGERRRIAQAGR